MAEQVVAEYKLQVDQAVSGLNKLQSEYAKTEAASRKAAQTSNDSFIKGSEGAKRLDAELKKQPKTLAEMELKLRNLRELLRDDTKIGTEGFKKIRAEIDKTEKEVQKLNGDLKKTGTEMSGLGGMAKKLGGFLAAAFAVDRIVAFGKEAVQLAAKAEGVERAFERIGSPQILQGLRDATRGTVSDIQLMQNAVKASNFKIPLESLASLFKFAQARARETGESVDYLVDSIILGIGRKSPLILDNLGISAVELRTRLKGVGVEAANVGDIAAIIGDIATEELAKMGNQADTTADKIAQFTTKFENLKVVLGKIIAEDSAGVLTFFGNLAQAISDDISELDRFKQSLSGQSGLKLLNILTEERAKLVQMEADATEKAGKVRDAEFNKIQEAVDFQREVVNSIMAELDARIDNNNEIEITNELIDEEIRKYKERQAEGEKYVRSLNQLNKELKDIDKAFKETEIGSQRWIELIGESEKKTQELTKALLKAQARLVMFQQAQRGFDPFAADNNIDSLFDIDELLSETKEIADSYIEETERATDIADRLWEAHFDKLMQETDDFNKKRKKDIEEEEKFQEMQRDMNQQFFNATLSSWQTLTYAISELSRAQYDEQQRGLENLLDKGIISQEEYERRRASLAREQFKKDKEAKLIQASINTALGVTNAIATAPNIILGLVLAAAAAAAGAAEIAVIASQPVPKFKDGGLVKEHGLLKGRSHAQGGIAVEAEGNEYFMPTQPTLKNYGLLEAMRKGIEEQYIMKHYVPQMMDASIFKGMNDIGNSAHLNGLTSGFKDHNLIAAIDRDRQSTTRVLGLIYQELKTNKKRDRYA